MARLQGVGKWSSQRPPTCSTYTHSFCLLVPAVGHKILMLQAQTSHLNDIRGDKHTERPYDAVTVLLRGFLKGTLGEVGLKAEQQTDAGLRTSTGRKSWADIYLFRDLGPQHTHPCSG